MQYWNELITEKSWNVLQRLRQKFKFALIGGWAVWLWTKGQKSKDVDLIVDLEGLENLKLEFQLKKNLRLKKYELKIDDVDVDVYATYYSKLSAPAEDVLKNTAEIEGFTVAAPEILLILKQGAEKERKHSEKGLKDRVDIMGVLINAKVDFKKYSELCKKHALLDFPRLLLEIVMGFRDYKYLGLTPPQLKKKKQELVPKIKSAL